MATANATILLPLFTAPPPPCIYLMALKTPLNWTLSPLCSYHDGTTPATTSQHLCQPQCIGMQHRIFLLDQHPTPSTNTQHPTQQQHLLSWLQWWQQQQCQIHMIAPTNHCFWPLLIKEKVCFIKIMKTSMKAQICLLLFPYSCMYRKSIIANIKVCSHFSLFLRKKESETYTNTPFMQKNVMKLYLSQITEKSKFNILSISIHIY